MSALKEMAQYTMELLELTEETVKVGRIDFNRIDNQTNYVVVDDLGSISISSSEKYDAENELMTYTKTFNDAVTINFYGPDALTLANDFAILNETQPAKELQFNFGITPYNPTTITNLKDLTGSYYLNRYEIALNVRYNLVKTLSILRIDEVQWTLTSD